MKKNINKNIALFLIAILCLSCDPPHSIEFINNSDSELKIKFKIDTTITNNDLNYVENKKGDLIVFTIKEKDTAFLDFGIGTWSESEIKKQVKSFNTLEIENSDFKKTLKSKREMEKFLIENREGGIGWKTKIVIEIKE